MAWRDTGVEASTVVSPVTVEIDGSRRLLVYTRSGWFAAEDRCSHAGCSFIDDGEVDGDVLVCNCHGSEFDAATGAVLVPPADRPIRTFAVRVSGDTLWVEQ